MASLLVTGGAGFIGSNFVRDWLGRNPDDRVVVIDALTYAGNRSNLADVEGASGFRFCHGDILDAELVTRLLRDHDIDTLVHFAAATHVDRSIADPGTFVETNVVGTQVLLECARRVWLHGGGDTRPHRFHHVSTEEVFGALGPDESPFTEDSPYAPNSPYSASKAASDHLVRAYYATYGLDVTVSYCGNNYGPFQFPEKLIPLAIVNALEGQSIPVYGDGTQIRDWIHVSDHVAGVRRVIETGTSGRRYCLGAGREISNVQVVQRLCRLIDKAFQDDNGLARRYPDAPAAKGQPSESLIEMVKDRPGHDWRYAIDASVAESELGFSVAVPFETGLESTVAWMLNNETWWRSVMDGSYRQWIELQYGASREAPI